MLFGTAFPTSIIRKNTTPCMLLLGRDSAVSAFAGIRTNALPILVSARSVSTKRGGSSSRYLQRQKTDVFVKQRQNIARTRETANDVALALSGSYVSRSAFKLLQLDDKYKFLRAGRTIVDLGAAPGGWTQAIIERVTRDRAKRGKKLDERTTPVFALDILPMSSIAGVTCLQGDFLDPNVQDKLRRLVAHKTQSNDSSVEVSNGGDLEDTEFFVDVVVSDMMSNTSGNSTADSEASLSLCQAAYVSQLV